MFILDSLMISGIRWALETAITAAEAEMNDDTVLREQLLAAELSREMGEISDEDFRQLEADLLARIREIKERREGGAGPLAFGGAQPLETSENDTFQVEASVSGDFHDPADAPHTTVVEHDAPEGHLGHLIETQEDQTVQLLDMEEGDAAESGTPALPVVRPRRRAAVKPRGRAAAKPRPRAAAAPRRSPAPKKRARRA